MIVQTFGNEIPIVVFKNILKEKHLAAMLSEIQQVKVQGKLLHPSQSGSAISETGEFKKNSGVFLDELYNQKDRNSSSILRIHRLVINPLMVRELVNKHPVFEYLQYTNRHSTLLNLYADGDSYFDHLDMSVLTSITYLWETPKRFTGGQIRFQKFDLTFDPELGDIIIFPGFLRHEVLEVRSKDLGERYSITQIFTIL